MKNGLIFYLSANEKFRCYKSPDQVPPEHIEQYKATKEFICDPRNHNANPPKNTIASAKLADA